MCGIVSDQFPLRNTPAVNHGSSIHQNKISSPRSCDQDNYHDFLQARLIQGIDNKEVVLAL